jgi:uncharacterized protein YndB with AHSA1/START domain
MKISKSIHVNRSLEDAFRLFTAELGKWWPLKEGFSFGRERAHEIFLEGRVGGRLFERYTDGTEFEIGRVTLYQPPRCVVFTWRPPEWEGPTEVEVRFAADGSGTRLELEHRGWEIGPQAAEQAKRYEGGWDIVLARYAAAV